ncbi:unnamed protein product [Kuraishia capsulata CBS 1993]|uniref:Ubiquitin-like protease family profile domain-containing protein n=1 Tax=Kuraishia capsulata CBS 1993 TaxID=1382522 RepID=W6MXN8_9ASCO|nr:uncharacterized protein KUCA_T00005203001 [Kuraishia capsulata CBS 1993]CDK29215.1 unnamed protein product [Kuraishia capsulata CBS 1993]
MFKSGKDLSSRQLHNLIPPKKFQSNRKARYIHQPMNTLSSSPVKSPEISTFSSSPSRRPANESPLRPKSSHLNLAESDTDSMGVKKVIILTSNRITIRDKMELSVSETVLLIKSPGPTHFKLEIALTMMSLIQVDNVPGGTNFVITTRAPCNIQLTDTREVYAESFWIFVSGEDLHEVSKLYSLFKKQPRCKFESVSGHELNERYGTKEIAPISTKDFYGNTTERSPLQSSALSRRLTRSSAPKDLSMTEQIQLMDEPHTPTKRNRSENQHEDIPLKDQIVFEPSLKFKFDDNSTFTITNSDFSCLYNNNWINDAMIDFFLKYDLQKVKHLEKEISKYKVELLNSFFYTRLIQGNNEDCYENVKSWFKNKDDLFLNDLIVIPIVHEFHWLCVMVSGLNSLIQPSQVDEMPKANFTVLDSLGGDRYPFMPPLRRFFVSYAQDKYGVELNTRQLKTRRLPVPKQRNFNDCGIHVIYNVRRIFSDYEQYLGLTRRSPKKSRQVDGNFFPRDELKILRSRLRSRLVNLLKEQVLAEGGDVEMVGKVAHERGSFLPQGSAAQNEDYDDEDDDDLQIIEEPSFRAISRDNTSKSDSNDAPSSPDTKIDATIANDITQTPLKTSPPPLHEKEGFSSAVMSPSHSSISTQAKGTVAMPEFKPEVSVLQSRPEQISVSENGVPEEDSPSQDVLTIKYISPNPQTSNTDTVATYDGLSSKRRKLRNNNPFVIQDK